MPAILCVKGTGVLVDEKMPELFGSFLNQNMPTCKREAALKDVRAGG